MRKEEHMANTDYLKTLIHAMKSVADSRIKDSTMFDINVAIVEQVNPDSVVKLSQNGFLCTAKLIIPLELKKNDSVVVLSFTTGARTRYILGKSNPKVRITKEEIIDTIGFSPVSPSQLGAIVNVIYPVGSIYMSVNNVNPALLFGGSWVTWGNGKVPVGVDTAQTEFTVVEKTGGSKESVLTESQLPSHTHAATISKTNLTSESSGILSSDESDTLTSESGGGSTSGSSGTSTTGNTTATNNSSGSLTSGSGGAQTISGGSHGHDSYYKNDNTTGGSAQRLGTSSNNSGSHSTHVVSGGSHSHAVDNHTHSVPSHNHTQDAHSHSIPAHTHSTPDHTHTIPPHSHTIPTHEHSIPTHDHTSTIESTGSGAAHSNLQPYITCYMWKRTS